LITNDAVNRKFLPFSKEPGESHWGLPIKLLGTFEAPRLKHNKSNMKLYSVGLSWNLWLCGLFLGLF